MDSAFVDRAWDKWVTTGNVGSSGKFSDLCSLSIKVFEKKKKTKNPEKKESSF